MGPHGTRKPRRNRGDNFCAKMGGDCHFGTSSQEVRLFYREKTGVDWVSSEGEGKEEKKGV